MGWKHLRQSWSLDFGGLCSHVFAPSGWSCIHVNRYCPVSRNLPIFDDEACRQSLGPRTLARLILNHLFLVQVRKSIHQISACSSLVTSPTVGLLRLSSGELSGWNSTSWATRPCARQAVFTWTIRRPASPVADPGPGVSAVLPRSAASPRTQHELRTQRVRKPAMSRIL